VNQRQFKIISFLLGLALMCIVVMQIVWVRTMVANSKKELLRQFSEALTNTSNELQRLEDTKRVSQNIMEGLDQNQLQSQFSNINVSSTTRKNNQGTKVRDTSFTIIQYDSSSDNKNRILIKKVQNYGDGDYTDSVFTKVILSDTQVKINDRMKNIDSLIKKLVVEFEKKDIDIRERINEKQVTEVLTKELHKKGLDVPFEFAVFNNKTKPLIYSKGYIADTSHLIMPLFMQDVYRKKSFLTAYPSNLSAYIWSNLKDQLSLSIIFTVLILAIFIITFRAILKQKKISEIKNDFINNMTHELKTPIATISLIIDALKNPLVKNNADQYNSYMNVLKEENDRLNGHVESVLQVALLDQGNLELNYSEIDVVNLIKNCIENFKMQIQNKGATVNIKGSTISKIQADVFHITNVFNNLIDNALKYSKEKCEVEIHIKEENNLISISVKDNGIGMTKEVQKKIFDKFYRAEGGNIHTVKGFGLGLSYIRSIVEAHQGSIEVHSELNNGSEFIVKLKK